MRDLAGPLEFGAGEIAIVIFVVGLFVIILPTISGLFAVRFYRSRHRSEETRWWVVLGIFVAGYAGFILFLYLLSMFSFG